MKNYYSHPEGNQCSNDFTFFSMTQNVLEIDVMVYNMTKNSKIYKKIFLDSVLEN